MPYFFLFKYDLRYSICFHVLTFDATLLIFSQESHECPPIKIWQTGHYEIAPIYFYLFQHSPFIQASLNSNSLSVFYKI